MEGGIQAIKKGVEWNISHSPLCISKTNNQLFFFELGYMLLQMYNMLSKIFQIPPVHFLDDEGLITLYTNINEPLQGFPQNQSRNGIPNVMASNSTSCGGPRTNLYLWPTINCINLWPTVDYIKLEMTMGNIVKVVVSS